MSHDDIKQKQLERVPAHLKDKFQEVMNQGNPMHDALSARSEIKATESKRQDLMNRMTVLEAYINDPGEKRLALLRLYGETKDIKSVDEAKAQLSQFQEDLKAINESDEGQEVIKAHEVRLPHEKKRE
jgi:hypothetical protein